jgi:hypothetical protein
MSVDVAAASTNSSNAAFTTFLSVTCPTNSSNADVADASTNFLNVDVAAASTNSSNAAS